MGAGAGGVWHPWPTEVVGEPGHALGAAEQRHRGQRHDPGRRGGHPADPPLKRLIAPERFEGLVRWSTFSRGLAAGPEGAWGTIRQTVGKNCLRVFESLATRNEIIGEGGCS